MANRYWVGGTAFWDGNVGTKWATTDGGASGASVPTSADDVFFTAKPAPTWQASTAYILTNIVSPVTGNGFHYECTTAGTTGSTEPTWPTVVGNTVTDGTVVWTCRSATVTIGVSNTGAKSINCTGFTGTITGTAAITVAGSVTLVAGMTYTHTGTVTFSGTGTLTTAGKTFSAVTVNGVGITLTLGDALNMSARTLTVTQGTFDTANYNVTAGVLSSSNSNTRTITLGSSTFTATSSTTVEFSTSTNLTFNAGTSSLSNGSNSVVFNGGGQTFYNVSFTIAGATAHSITGANTFNNLSLTASATGLTRLSISADQTVNGTFTCAGSSAVQRGFVRSDTIGTSRTITAATLTATDCDFRDITIAGGAAGTAPTRAGDCGGNSGITFPAAKTVYRVGTNTNWNSGASWALNSGGTGSTDNFPLAQDTAVIDNNTTLTGTLGGNIVYNIGTLDCSTRTTGITLEHSAAYLRYGSYTLGSGVTVSSTSTQTFSGRGTMTFTSAGNTITFPITVDAPGGTFQLGDATTTSSSITHTRGTFDANDYSLTFSTFASTNANTRTITMGLGLWTLSGTGNIWNLGTTTNLTFNKDTADILLSNTTTSSRTFTGGGLTYNKLTIGGATGTSTLNIESANTFSELASTKTVAHTITLGANQTVAAWTIAGTAGNVVTLNSSVAGTSRTLTKSGGGFLTGIDYLNVRDIQATPTDTWYIGANSVYNTTAPNTATGFFLTQRADNAIIVLTSTASTTWTVPSDWNNANNNIHLIGGGGGGAGGYASGNNRAGGGGGGGGGYTKLTNQTLTKGASITYQCGSAGTVGSVGANGGNGGTTSWNSGASTAGGGGGGQATTTPTSTGGTAGTGTTFNGATGGVGATGTAASTGYGGGGGAGAGGPNGVGGNGGNGFGSTLTANMAGGGGGGNGGGTNGGNASSATGGTGGNNSLGTGGGASNTSGVNGGGAGGSVSVVSTGGYGIEVFGIGSGGGGGGGIGSGNRANIGGLYGAGGGGGGVAPDGTTRTGGAGAQGAIIITYVPSTAVAATGNMFFMFN